MKRTRLRLSVSLILAFLVAMAAISLAPPVFTQQSHPHPPLTGTLSLDVPATISESDGSVSYAVRMVSAEDKQPFLGARLSFNVSSSNDVAHASDDFVAVDDDFTFTGSDFTRVETPQGSGTYRYVATATGQVALIDDPLVESDESFTLTLSTTTATEATIATATHRVVIEDDDTYGLAVSVDTVSIVEGQTDDITVTASVTPEADSCVAGFPIILDIQLSGSATVADDYTHNFGDGGDTLPSIRIPPCTSSLEWTMSLAAVLDTSADPGETIVFTAVARTGDSLEEPAASTPATVTIEDAFAAQFVDSTIPEWHDGIMRSEFTLQISFSEEIATTDTALRDHSFEVTNGRITRVSRVQDRKDLWEITITPTADDTVTVALPANRACDTDGAVCTAEGRQLSNRIETSITAKFPAPREVSLLGVSENSAEFIWETPDYPESQTLIGYQVYRIEINEENTVIRETQVKFEVRPPDSQDTPTTVHFTDSTVEPETTYRYWISAVFRYWSAGYEHTTRGHYAPTVDVTTLAPLTAQFVASSTPEWHDGSSEFTLQISFSEDIDIDVADFRDYSLDVTGGRLINVSRVRDRADLWGITIRPLFSGAVTVALPANRTCDTYGAICTADGRRLSRHIETRVRYDRPPLTELRIIGVASGSVELSWETPDYPEWRTLTGYRVYRKAKLDEEYGGEGLGFGNILQDSQNTSTTVYFTDPTVEPESTYLYRLFAVYAAGYSPSVSTGDVTTPPPPLSGTLSLEVPATVSESDGSVSYTVRMVSEEDRYPFYGARLSFNVSSSDDVAHASDDFVAVDDDFTFIASDLTRVETPQGSGTYRYVATTTGQVTLIDDPLVESDESFTLTLSTTTATEATIATATHRVVIEDDDTYGLAVSVDTVSIVEGQTDDITVTASVTPEADSCVAGFPIILDIQLSGSATVADDYTHNFGDGGDTLPSIRIPPCTSSLEWTMSLAAVLDTSADPGETIVFTAVARTGDSLEEPAASTPATVTIEDVLPFTAQFVDSTIPEWHDGSSEFTLELRFSEDPDLMLSYTTLQDHAFTVVGGEVIRARRLEPPGNVRWEITVRPNSRADVTIALPATEGCNAAGAVCAADGRKLSEGIEIRVSGPRASDS